jgi:hypothetical protein
MNRANLGWNLANMIDNDHLVAGTKTGVGPSPAIWASCPVLPILLDPTKGFVYFNDFLDYGGLSLSADGSENGITHTERTQGTIKNDPTVPGGIIELDAGATTADTGITMQLTGVQCEPKDGTTIYMEWRCNVEVGGGQMFMGLADDSATALVSSSDAIATDKDLVGFFRDAGTGDTDWSVGVCDGSSSEEADDKVVAASETAYEKFGIILRGIGAVAGSKAEFYHQGALVYTADDINDLPLLLMCPVFQADGDGTDRPYINLDWLRIAVHNTKTHCREG